MPPASTALVGSGTGLERALVEVLTDLVAADEIPVDGNFFDDLGADSMVMARFCAHLRKRSDLPTFSMRDIYEHPTIAELAASARGAGAEQPPVADQVPDPTRAFAIPAGTRRRGRRRVLCGTLQIGFTVGYAALLSLIVVRSFFWLEQAPGFVDSYRRAVVLAGSIFLVASIVPVVVKWVLIGRWKPRPIPIWSMAYFRFWVVRSLIRSSPIALLNGGSETSSSSPLFPLYLRALGAKIGSGVTIHTRNVPVCTDLLTIGDHTVVRKDAFLNCYRARAGVIEPGRVTLGSDVVVGESTVLDIDTTIEDGAELGHASALQSGQTVRAGERSRGNPAQPSEGVHRLPATPDGFTRRRVVFTAFQLLNLTVLTVPLVMAGSVFAIVRIPELELLVGAHSSSLSLRDIVATLLLVSAILTVGSLLAGLLVVGTVPRVLKRFVEPGRVYPVYGIRYLVHRTIAGLTNVRFYTQLFGDSSFIVHYLRWIGYDLTVVDQTGSNFGSNLKHESPFLTTVGTGTMVADGLSAMNAEFSSTSFRLAPVTIGAKNFLGNNIAYPADARVGDDCLLATKVAVPVTGETRNGVGLLGSPDFQIPRSVERDKVLEIAHNEELLRPILLKFKNRHNIVTMVLFLAVRWIFVTALLLLVAGTFAAYQTVGSWTVVLVALLTPLVTVGYWVAVERSVARLQALAPDGCSIYHRSFWRHERFWKIPAFRYVQVYNGTPFKPIIWRLLGVKIGRDVFDDGCFFVEKSFVTIGDSCTLNARTIVQCHSQEDGGFKSDRSEVGPGCTLGVGAFVHYGVTIGADSVVAADSFLMKGQQVPPRTTWVGNPAQEAKQ